MIFISAVMCGSEEDFAHVITVSSKVTGFQVEVRRILLFETVPHISSFWFLRLSRFLGAKWLLQHWFGGDEWAISASIV